MSRYGSPDGSNLLQVATLLRWAVRRLHPVTLVALVKLASSEISWSSWILKFRQKSQFLSQIDDRRTAKWTRNSTKMKVIINGSRFINNISVSPQFSFEFPFEKQFKPEEHMAWMQTNWVLAIHWCAAYVLLVFIGKVSSRIRFIRLKFVNWKNDFDN